MLVECLPPCQVPHRHSPGRLVVVRIRSRIFHDRAQIRGVLPPLHRLPRLGAVAGIARRVKVACNSMRNEGSKCVSSVDDVEGNGPGRYCSPRYRLPLNSTSEDSKCVSMTW